MLKINSECLIVLVSYFSNGWTQNCIRSLQKHIPNIDILVIDNNPSIHDSIERANSFSGSCTNSNGLLVQNSLVNCEMERSHLKRFRGLKSIQSPLKFSHGQCLNLAIQYAFKYLYKYMIHIEPDCLIKGPCWFSNLLDAADSGAWMAGSTRFVTGHLHPTPSIWDVKQTHHLDFVDCPLANYQNEPEFPDLYNVKFEKGFARKYVADFYRAYFDTAVKAWYYCAKHNKTKHVKNPDLIHLWAKSSNRFSGLI